MHACDVVDPGFWKGQGSASNVWGMSLHTVCRQLCHSSTSTHTV